MEHFRDAPDPDRSGDAAAAPAGADAAAQPRAPHSSAEAGESDDDAMGGDTAGRDDGRLSAKPMEAEPGLQSSGEAPPWPAPSAYDMHKRCVAICHANQLPLFCPLTRERSGCL